MTTPRNSVSINTNQVGIEYHNERNKNPIRKVTWKAKGLKITRLRMLSDAEYPYWDISYCHGILNGEDVNVQLPFRQIPKKWANDPDGHNKGFIINMAKHFGVYAKGLGILDAFSQTQA